MRLLNATQLAAATGFSRATIEAMKGEPDSPFAGGRYATADAVTAWIMAHPDWRASHAWKNPLRRVHPQRQQRLDQGEVTHSGAGFGMSWSALQRAWLPNFGEAFQ